MILEAIGLVLMVLIPLLVVNIMLFNNEDE